MEEARLWMSGCINDEIPKVTEGMEEFLRNGVVLAKLAKFILPEKRFRIYDEDLRKLFEIKHLQYTYNMCLNIFKLLF